jgi:hypothetical protein
VRVGCGGRRTAHAKSGSEIALSWQPQVEWQPSVEDQQSQ